ncbi:hypothetical protein ACA910_018661 [Epithemia clementina (nom. ined.)]
MMTIITAGTSGFVADSFASSSSSLYLLPVAVAFSPIRSVARISSSRIVLTSTTTITTTTAKHWPSLVLTSTNTATPFGLFAATNDNNNANDNKNKNVRRTVPVEMDYEYIPSTEKYASSTTTSSSPFSLPSSYPPDTPAGLRGEAVRSALRSGRCLGWAFDKYNAGMSGRGCVDFLNNLLSQTFAAAAAPSKATTTTSTTTTTTNMMGSFQLAALLTSKGRMIDQLGVALFFNNNQNENENDNQNENDQEMSTAIAYLITSPGGHAPSDLANRLDRYIFPMDQVSLPPLPQPFQFQFTLASYDVCHIQQVWQGEIVPRLAPHIDPTTLSSSAFLLSQPLPEPNQCWRIPLSFITENTQLPSSSNNKNGNEHYLLILPTVSLPPCAAVGHTFVFVSSLSDHAARLGHEIWRHVISEQCAEGPIELGPLEWESLRIEAGQPRFGCEYTGHLEPKKLQGKSKPATLNTTTTMTTTTSTTMETDDSSQKTPTMVAASPLELFQSHLLAPEKGCFMGQEGIASMSKNPKGPPRTLYQVVFEDEFNVYDYQTQNDQQAPNVALENNTRLPQPGDTLSVLGSNDQIVVGTLTSVAEPGSTGTFQQIHALALIRRPQSILAQMKELGLSVPTTAMAQEGGLILPPPMDPLHGVEVIVQGSFCVGRLQSIPSRRYHHHYNRGALQQQRQFNNSMFLLSDRERRIAAGLPDDNDGNYNNYNYNNNNENTVIDVTKIPLSSAASGGGYGAEMATKTRDCSTPTTTILDPWDLYNAQQEEDNSVRIGQNMDEALIVGDYSTDDMDDDDDDDSSQEDEEELKEELERAEQEAKAAAAEAQRKAEKMAMLQQRAEQALAARRQKKKQQQSASTASPESSSPPSDSNTNDLN